MAYGYITPAMEAVLTHIVREKVVYDLGAGDLEHAQALLRLGARQVEAVEKEPLVTSPDARIRVTTALFEQARPPAEGIDVAFVSWPLNRHLYGLVEWLEAAETVVYLGHNFDGTSCGFPDLFTHLLGRRLLTHIPYYRNSLIVVGEALSQPRGPTTEEAAFLAGNIIRFPH